ncbi:MAG: UDP-N-acetylmuramate dehydrogenase [Gammaproteobacteria bacterium]
MAAMDMTSDLRGTLKLDEPMSKHTTWRVGGSADRYYEPADIEDMANYLRQLPEKEQVTLVGLGSNLLIRDKGIRGSVICPTGLLNGFEFLDDNKLRVEAGVPCAIVAKRCAKDGFSGLEFLAGIPGTIGGALAMNAGAFGGETWPNIQKVEVLDREGQFHVRSPDQYLIGYRSVIGPMDGLLEEWFVSAHFTLKSYGNSNEIEEGTSKIKKLLAKRSETQPTGVASCGSVFRNPHGDFAARLIEACGLKGHQIGGAQVSEKHANFIINLGNSSAADIENLILLVAEEVKKKQGVTLESEVRIVGDV